MGTLYCVNKVNTLINSVKDKYPMTASFSYEPRKGFYIANEIAKSADALINLGTLYDDDTSINLLACFNHGKEVEYSVIVVNADTVKDIAKLTRRASINIMDSFFMGLIHPFVIV